MRKKKLIFIGGIAVLALVVFAGMRMYGRRKAAKAAAENRSKVETVQVTKQNLINSISVTGTIASADAWDVSASAKDVEVLKVNYEVGDYVNEGDVIVVLDSKDLEISLTQAQNKQALSAYTESKSIENASEKYEEAVEDGTDDYNKAVKKEAEAKEDLQEAESDLAEAASRLKRREEAVGEAEEALAAASKPKEPSEDASEEEKAAYEAEMKEYSDLEKAVSEAQASYTEAHQAYNAAADAEEKAVDTYENASEALEDAQKQNERNISDAADTLEKAQAEHTYSNDSSQQTIENYQKQIESCTVTSPISGIITEMKVAEGDTYMGEGNVLFSVANNEKFIVAASVDEYDISSISKDMDAAVIVEALGDEELPAKVSFVSPTASGSNTGSASYAVEIALDDKNTDLRIGMTAKASIVLDAAYDVLTVPYDCVETDGDGNAVLYIDRDGEKTPVPVEVGMQGDYYVEVSGEGLDENTFVYYSVPMVNEESSTEESDDSPALTLPMGGGLPGGGSRGGGGHGGENRDGGGPGGGF